MSAASCAMASLVEARRDGRLGDIDAASIDRHLATCSDCASFAGDLERLAELARVPLAPRPALERRRGRVRLLQGAAEPAPSPRREWIPLVAAALLAVSAVAIAAGTIARSPRSSPVLASAGLTKPSAPLVALCMAKAARPEAAESDLAASKAQVPSDALVLSDTSSRSMRPSAKSIEQSPVAPLAARSPAPIASARAGSGDGSAASFDDAVALVERGDYGAATERLDRFRQEHRQSPRAEDAAFLAIVALERAGRRADAIAAARSYLHDYPNGYRRGEALAIVARGAGDAGAHSLTAPE